MINFPSVVFDIETNMRALVDDEFARLQDPRNTWWDLAATRLTTGTKKQILTWFVSSAKLYDQGKGGNFDFAEPQMITKEITPGTAGAALKIRRTDLEDIDGNGMIGGEGVQAATKWAKDMGHQFGYWPQEKIAELVTQAETGTTYDGLAFFHAAHYTNGIDSSDGTFANLLSGSTYAPSASATDDTVLAALAAVYKAMRAVKFPTGQVRMLRPSAILCGPALYPKMARLLDAKFIAANASVSGAGGTADFAGHLSRMGYGKVTEAPELVDSEWDTNYIVLADRGGEAELGPFAYVDREPFSIRYYTGRGGGVGVDAILDRADMLEWHASGRNVATYGHPFLAFKAKA